MGFRCLDSPPKLLYLSGDLHILGYTFYVRFSSCWRSTELIVYHITSMTSRLFLNLRSAGSSTPSSSQPNLTTALPLGNRQYSPPESDQTTSGSKPPAVTLDTTLFAMVSHMDRSAYSDQEQALSGHTAESKPGEEFGGGDDHEVDRGALPPCHSCP